MLEDIFDSKIKVKIMRLLISRKTALSGSEIARLLKISKSRTSECLKDLQNIGVLDEQHAGKTILYSLSSNSIAKSVKNIFNEENKIQKNAEKNFVAECKKLKPVSIALFGSSVNGLRQGSDIDILVLYANRLDKERLSNIASKLTAKSGVRISPISMEIKRFTEDARAGNEFVINILAKHELLYGKNLEVLVWQGK